MYIVQIASECAPVIKAGGLGDVVYGLSRELEIRGNTVELILPKYDCMRYDHIWGLHEAYRDLAVPWYGGEIICDVFCGWVHGQLCFFIEPKSQDNFFNRGCYYGCNDDNMRFAFFSKAALEFLLRSNKRPDIIHCHDWHTGMIPVWMHQDPDISTVFTIHNLAYQGPWRWKLEQMTWCPWYMQGHNTMAAAVQFADRVNTVSPTYAQQIKTAAYGETLEGLLSFIGGKVSGILNGIDTESYNPATDKYIHQQFTADTIEKRPANKIALQEEVGLEVNKSAFLIGMVTRLVEQKGLDLIIQMLDRFMAYTDAQFIVLGTGDRYYETQLWQMTARYPGRMSTQLLYNEAPSRRVYAGCDTFLMPSRFEPCGISQMLALRYGCVPMVRRTGGLVDTVSHNDPINNTGTGYCFDRYEPLDLFTCMIRTWEGFRYKDKWKELQQRGMREDFSWDISAKEYVKLYSEVLRLPPEELAPEEPAPEQQPELILGNS